MILTAYLAFDGQCEEAFKTYERLLKGKLEAMIPHAGSPAEEQVPPEWRNKIMHARLNVGGEVLMGGDAPPGSYRQPQAFSVMLQIESPQEAERIFQGLAENGRVQMPLQQTFWAQRFGMLTDRFGIPWMINCEAA